MNHKWSAHFYQWELQWIFHSFVSLNLGQNICCEATLNFSILTNFHCAHSAVRTAWRSNLIIVYLSLQFIAWESDKNKNGRIRVSAKSFCQGRSWEDLIDTKISSSHKFRIRKWIFNQDNANIWKLKITCTYVLCFVEGNCMFILTW